MARVLIAEANIYSRSGMRLALERGGLVVCAEAGDVTVAVEAAGREHPDVCLIDMDLPGGGVVAAAEIDARLPDASIVMLTGSPDLAELIRVLRAGARGYLPKAMDPRRLPDTVKSVARGEAAIPRRLVGRMIEEQHRHTHALSVGDGSKIQLTRREWEILERIRDGATTDQIAGALSISPVTVRRHVSALLRKLGVRDRAAAVRIAEGA
jgi:two-component system nitrate/nitrite response regulator NarL